MLNSGMKKLALFATVAVMWSASADAQDTLQIASTPVFGKAANDFSDAFGSWYSLHDNVNYSVGLFIDSDSDIEAGIINGTVLVDLFISATPEIPERLARDYPKLVVGRPFPVAIDSLLLYCPSVDISAGLPFPLTTTIAIPYPPDDNYGAAAAHILAQEPWRIPTSSLPLPFAPPTGLVATYPSEGVTFSALKAGRYPYGFIARSQVCRLDTLTPNSTDSYPAGSFHHVYAPFGPHPYDRELVTLTAIRIAQNRTALQDQALENYVAFLTDTKDTFGNTNILPDGFTFGQDSVRAYCFRMPQPLGREAVSLDQ